MEAVARKRSIDDGGEVGELDHAGDASPRKLRRGKERRVYSEDLVDRDADSYIDGQRSFDLQRECCRIEYYRVWSLDRCMSVFDCVISPFPPPLFIYSCRKSDVQ